MNNKQQTAVEWLRQELLKRDMDVSVRELFEKAKEMEKQRAIKFACDVHMNVKKDKVKSLMQLVDEKYNSTYGGNK
jgi:uncharacterized OsmC-like protein